MSGSKLVENLAESLVNELSESKTLDLMNDQKFSEFTDLLWEILDRVDKAEDRAKAKDEEEKKDKSNEDESLDSVKKLAETITNYFGKGNSGADGKTDKILKIVQSLQKDEKEEGGGESDEDKKKKKLTLGKKTKEQKDIEETKEKKEEEKKEEEKANLDKQTVAMLTKLSKNFEKAEKERKKQNSWVRRGLKRVERKVGSLIWKALNKFKGILLIGALIFFRKPIINWFKKIWSEHIEPLVAPLFEKLGRIAGGLWEDIKKWFKAAFPSVADWIKNDWPKVQDWFKENWDKLYTFFSETLWKVVDGVDKWLQESEAGRWIRKKIYAANSKNIAKEIAETDYGDDTEGQIKEHERYIDFNKSELEVIKSSNFDKRGYILKRDANGKLHLWQSGEDRKQSYIDFYNQKIKSEQAAIDKLKGLPLPTRDSIPTSSGSNTKSSVNANGMSVPSDVNNDNLPEYGNAIGGNSQYSFNDMEDNNAKNLFDFGRVSVNMTPFTQNNMYIFKVGEVPLYHQP